MDGSEKITGPESKRILILDLGMVSEVRAVAKRSYHTPEVRGGGKRSNPTSNVGGCARVEWSYSMFKVRRGGREGIPLIQGK